MNPLDAMQVAVTRRHLDADGPAMLPDPAISLERIRTACTAGSAYVTHREHGSGALDVGKLADLTILDR